MLCSAAIAAFFTEDVVQIEYPNRPTADGATRDLAALVARRQRGLAAVANERYAIRNDVVSTTGDLVAFEIDWSAELKRSVGTLATGQTMRASFGVFLSYRDGKICAQRNYDCFAPF